TNPTTTSITGTFLSPTVDTTGAVTYASATVNVNLSTEGLEFIKPAGWTRRRAPGEIQRAAGDLIQVRLRLIKGLQDYDNLLSQIEDQADLLQAQYAINKN